MNTRLFPRFLLPALIAGLGLILTGRVTAQTFTTLHSFTKISPDGAYPVAGLISSGNTLYGTAELGGINGGGTVFAINTNGTAFTNLSSFTDVTDPGGDGLGPEDGLVLSGNTLYGTAASGGTNGNGTLFKVNTNGAGFTGVYIFTATRTNSLRVQTNSDGTFPRDGLILSGNTLYGTAASGGSSGFGTVFTVNTDGTGFTTLHSFTATSATYPFTNSDGANPYAGLILSGNTLYGTAEAGGLNGAGTVFAVNTDGTNFTVLHTFSILSDGDVPNAGLVLSGNTLYGTAQQGSSPGGNGTVFAVNTNGTGFTNLYSFTGGSDGGFPEAGLILSGNTLYGTTLYGGSSDNGTVFKINTDGTGFTNLYSFTALIGAIGFNGTNSDGANPVASLILSGNTLYGTASEGGSSGWGTVFSLSLGAVTVTSPQLTIIGSGANVILTWPTNATGFTLQSTTNLAPPVVWPAVSPAPVVINGNNTVTNAISGTQKFYRLSQ